MSTRHRRVFFCRFNLSGRHAWRLGGSSCRLQDDAPRSATAFASTDDATGGTYVQPAGLGGHHDTGGHLMLVTFRSEAYPSITMFGDVAVTLIKLMGHSGAVPGALMPEDVPPALERLKAAVAANPNVPLDPERERPPHRESEQTHVSIAHRALPLIELLTAAAAQRKYVMWES
jgi:hypothetical protein